MTARFHLDTEANDLYFDMDGVEVPSVRVEGACAPLKVIMRKNANPQLEAPDELWLAEFGWFRYQAKHSPHGMDDREDSIRQAVDKYGERKVELAFRDLALALARHAHHWQQPALPPQPPQPTNARVWKVHEKRDWSIEDVD